MSGGGGAYNSKNGGYDSQNSMVYDRIEEEIETEYGDEIDGGISNTNEYIGLMRNCCLDELMSNIQESDSMSSVSELYDEVL